MRTKADTSRPYRFDYASELWDMLHLCADLCLQFSTHVVCAALRLAPARFQFLVAQRAIVLGSPDLLHVPRAVFG